MAAWIVPVDAAAEHGYRPPAGFQSTSMRLTVDPTRQSAHDNDPRRRKLSSEQTGDLRAIRGAAPRTDDGHRSLVQEFRAATTQVEVRRRIVQLSQKRRIPGIGSPYDRIGHVAPPSSDGVR